MSAQFLTNAAHFTSHYTHTHTHGDIQTYTKSAPRPPLTAEAATAAAAKGLKTSVSTLVGHNFPCLLESKRVKVSKHADAKKL